MVAVSTLQVCSLRIAFALTIVVCIAAGADAATATWDRNTEPDVAGYKLSYGTQPGVHTVTIDAGNVTTCQFNPPSGQRYYVVVQAYNTAGELSEKSAEVIIDVPATSPAPAPQPSPSPAPAPPPATGTATATFSGSDTVTQGNWRGVYGADGEMEAPSTLALPSYAQVAVGAVTYTWDANAVDPRALQLPTGASRVAATWYAADAFAFNIAITDGKAHCISLYGVDYDRLGRAEAIEVLDAATLKLLDRRDATSMFGGIYLTWQISGHVIIRITRLSGPNAVVAGLFFGSPAAAPAPAVASPDGTLVPPATRIVDGAGAVWTLATDRGVLRNGVLAAGGYGTKLLWSGGVLYTFGLDSNWYKWAGSGWTNIGSVQPGGSVSPAPAPAPPASGPSAAGTLVPPAGQIVDATGAVWALAADTRVLRNGVHAAGGYATKLLWSGNTLYAFGLDNNWWKWTGSSWTNVGATTPR